MEHNGLPTTSKKTTGFILALVAIFLSFFLSINMDLGLNSQHDYLKIPEWFIYVLFFVDGLVALSLIFIYFYRKIGVFLLPFLILLHFSLHQFYLSAMLYSDVFTLFMYFAAGLVVIIPRWDYFKWL